MRQDDIGKAVDVRVDQISQLFQDGRRRPSRERKLDQAAEQHIVGAARKLPKTQPIRIVVHLPGAEATQDNARDVEGALARYFALHADAAAFELNELFRNGRRSLAIGLTVLAVCFAAMQIVSGRLDGPFGRFVEESLVILGWVACWRPFEVFLYEWWPIAQRRDLYRRLAKATVALQSH